MKAIVNVPICAMYEKATRQSTVADEVIYGMVVEILEEIIPGWLRIRTHYRYEGIVCAEDLLIDEETAGIWESREKKIIWNKNFCDVLSEPKVQGWIKITLPMGAVVAPIGEQENGWQLIQLADGSSGYVPAGILGTHFTEPAAKDEQSLRRAIVDAAMRYSRSHYRWGGKTPNGIDCSGLCSMAYMLCGILIYRDAKIVEGFPLHEICKEDMKPADLIFFPGHVAMYLGNDRYCHATAKAGCNGFTINSLNPADPDFREDLLEKITGIVSYF